MRDVYGFCKMCENQKVSVIIILLLPTTIIVILILIDAHTVKSVDVVIFIFAVSWYIVLLRNACKYVNVKLLLTPDYIATVYCPHPRLQLWLFLFKNLRGKQWKSLRIIIFCQFLSVSLYHNIYLDSSSSLFIVFVVTVD